MRKLITALVATFTILLRWLHRGESRGGAKTDVPSNEKLYPNRKGCLLPPIRPATLSPWLPLLYGYGYGYRPYYGYGYHRPYYGYGYRRYGWRY